MLARMRLSLLATGWTLASLRLLLRFALCHTVSLQLLLTFPGLTLRTFLAFLPLLSRRARLTWLAALMTAPLRPALALATFWALATFGSLTAFGTLTTFFRTPTTPQRIALTTRFSGRLRAFQTSAAVL
jgi:hypothetical protein